MIFPHLARSIGDVENLTCTLISNSLVNISPVDDE